MDTEWRKLHGKVISELLKDINESTDNYVLKGGTALMMCYKLDRFSEDIDLDSTDHSSIKKIVDDFCRKINYSYRVAKNIDTVQRYMLNYGNERKPLKIEISYRNKNIDPLKYQKINGINVYKIDSICLMKASAYNGRDKIRDLYDLTYICHNYWEELSEVTREVAKTSVEFKGIEQFDYLINTQKDELIDNDKLASDFLELYDKLGLLIDKEELQNSSIEIKSKSTSSMDDWKSQIAQMRDDDNSKKEEISPKAKNDRNER